MAFEEFFDYGGDRATATVTEDDGPVLGATWSQDRWDVLLGYAERLRVRAGERLIRQGEVERAVYIVEAGALEAVVSVRNGTRRFPMTEGTVLGEVAFFDGRPRSADVVAASDAQVQRISAQAIETMSARHPDLARAFLMDLGKILAFRLRRAESLARD